MEYNDNERILDKMTRRTFIKKTAAVSAATVAASMMSSRLFADTPVGTIPVSIVRGNDLVLNDSIYYDLIECFQATKDTIDKDLIKPKITWTDDSQLEIDQMVQQAVDLVGGLPVEKKDRVLIKPNIVQPPHIPLFNASNFTFTHALAAITDPRVVIALVKICIAQGAKEIYIAEGTGSSVGNLWFECGYEQAVDKLKNNAIELVNLENSNASVMNSQLNLALKNYTMPQMLNQIDVVISVAALKTHMFAGTTLTMKNFVGFVPGNIYGNFRAALPHGSIAEVIVDLTSIVQKRVPKVFGVVSGIYGGEGPGPLLPSPVPMNLVIAGYDLVAVDTVGTTVMGFNAEAIGHIRVAEQYGLGSMRNIALYGNPLYEVQQTFQSVPVSSRWPGGQVTDWESHPGQQLPS